MAKSIMYLTPTLVIYVMDRARIQYVHIQNNLSDYRTGT